VLRVQGHPTQPLDVVPPNSAHVGADRLIRATLSPPTPGRAELHPPLTLCWRYSGWHRHACALCEACPEGAATGRATAGAGSCACGLCCEYPSPVTGAAGANMALCWCCRACLRPTVLPWGVRAAGNLGHSTQWKHTVSEDRVQHASEPQTICPDPKAACPRAQQEHCHISHVPSMAPIR
jgi:hypothetical protein